LPSSIGQPRPFTDTSRQCYAVDMSKEREQQPEDLTLERVVRQAREVLLMHGEHPPMLIIVGSQQNALGPLSHMAATHEERVQQLFGAGFAVGQAHTIGELKQVFFTCESWMSMAQDQTPPVMPPSQDPNRVEALIISNLRIEGKEQRRSIVILEMVRDKKGKLVDVRELQRIEEETEHQVYSPLLLAFVSGFRMGSHMRGRPVQ
jgi:hypothetical protein